MSKLVLKLAGKNAISNAPVYVEVLDYELENVAELAILINHNHEIQLEPGKYLIKVNLPSGQVIKKALVLENKLNVNEVVLPLISSTNQELEWQEFLGNTYTRTSERKISQIPSIWQRLWSYEQKTWKVERWPNKWKLPQNERAIKFSLELPQNKLWLLQIGGSEIPWRFTALPPGSHLKLLVHLSKNEPNADIAVVVTSQNNQEAETLLSYLISGNIRAAKVVGDNFVERLLSEESFETLEATIGGYYLLKVGDDERLAQWVNKFVNLIQWLPDILVIHSWFLLREDGVPRVELARSRLLEAIKQGIPVYTEGMRLLFDGLLLFNQDALARHEQDVEIEQALELIRGCAVAADWSKPLTTFYGVEPRLPSLSITGIPEKEAIGLVWLTLPAKGDNRRQAYLNLIEALLNCPNGEEPAILEANQILIDARLVQTMLDYAINLATRNETVASERLIKIVVNLLITLRNANFESQEFTEAIEYYEQLLTICQERSYQQIEMMLLYYIRLFYRYTDDYAKAIESSKRLLVIAQSFENRFLEAETLFHLGIDYQGLRDLDSARNNYEQSLAIAEQIDDEAGKKLLVDILNTLGSSYNPPYDWGLDIATNICTKSLRIAQEIGYRHGEAVALTCIGKAHYCHPGERRNFPEAIKYYERAKVIFQETGDLEKEVDALYHLQDSYSFTSNYAKAIECNNKLLTIARNLNNRLLEAHALFDVGRNYDALGLREKEKAKNYYEQSLAIANLIDNQAAHWLQIRNLQGLGEYYRVNGDLTAAEGYYQESLKIAENISEEQGQANALQVLAGIYYYQGNLNQAWEYNERSLTLKERLYDQIGTGNSISFRGSIYLARGEYTEALNEFKQSLGIMKAVRNYSEEASTLTDIGIALLYLDQIEEAQLNLREGIKLWESVRGRLQDRDDSQISIIKKQAVTYQLLEAVLIDQSKPLAALEIAKRGQVRALVESLTDIGKFDELTRVKREHPKFVKTYSVIA